MKNINQTSLQAVKGVGLVKNVDINNKRTITNKKTTISSQSKSNRPLKIETQETSSLEIDSKRNTMGQFGPLMTGTSNSVCDIVNVTEIVPASDDYLEHNDLGTIQYQKMPSQGGVIKGRSGRTSTLRAFKASNGNV